MTPIEPTPAYKIAHTIRISQELLMDDPEYVRAHPWLLPDPNPMPTFRLIGWRRK